MGDCGMARQEAGRAYQTVIDLIKRKIIHNEVQLGDNLPPERELAETLGVSRTSVREALRTLEVMGIITSTQGAGNVISGNFEKSLSESLAMMFLVQKIDYKQISELRCGLEKTMIVLAVDKISKEQIDLLETLIEAMEHTTDEIDNVDLDEKLHYTIAKAASNPLIVTILQALADVMHLFIKDLRKKIIAVDKGKNRLQMAHKHMVMCLKAGDKVGAQAAIEEHFQLVDENLRLDYVVKNTTF